MIRIFATALALLMAGQTMAAELCDDLWFARNLVFDQAGYCFGSPLGRVIFDNSDCTTNTPVLDDEAQAFVAWVKGLEKLESCQVDTGQTTLHVPLIEIRKQIVDRVAASPFESACIGWHGGEVALRLGHGLEHPIIGFATAGDDIHWEFEWVSAPDGWDFITVKRRDGVSYAMGWSNAFIDPQYCDSMAG